MSQYIPEEIVEKSILDCREDIITLYDPLFSLRTLGNVLATPYETLLKRKRMGPQKMELLVSYIHFLGFHLINEPLLSDLENKIIRLRQERILLEQYLNLPYCACHFCYSKGIFDLETLRANLKTLKASYGTTAYMYKKILEELEQYDIRESKECLNAPNTVIPNDRVQRYYFLIAQRENLKEAKKALDASIRSCWKECFEGNETESVIPPHI